MENMHENDAGNDFKDRSIDPMAEFRDQLGKRMQDMFNLHVDILDDGVKVNVSGFPDEYRGLNHEQGDNPYGFKGTCGLVSCEDILNQYGVSVTESDIVSHAIANDLCAITDDPEQSGGTTPFSQAEILKDFGVYANVAVMPDLDKLAEQIESGRSAVIEVNAGLLWDYGPAYGSGDSNHAVVVTGCARDAESGIIRGFYINDSGRGDMTVDSKRFISNDKMERCFLETGGVAVITMDTHQIPLLIHS